MNSFSILLMVDNDWPPKIPNHRIIFINFHLNYDFRSPQPIYYRLIQMDQGNKYKDQERYADAIKEYDKYIQQFPSVPAGRANKAFCLVKLGQFQDALV